MFQDFGGNLEDGWGPKEAMEAAIEKTVADGFYSFFDTAVDLASNTALVGGAILLHRGTTAADVVGDDQVTRLLTELRYVGSVVAIGAVSVGFGLVGISDPLNRDADDEQDTANDVNDLIFAEAGDSFGGTAFFLGPEYLPFATLIMEPMFGGMMNGVMKNVLSHEEDLRPTLIENSNISVTTSYSSTGGAFPAAVRRFKTNGMTLQSRFYLVTQPWHITRRVTPDGDYRDIGDEDDDVGAGNTSEEAALKRRVMGLWLIPSDPVAMITPIADLIPGGEGLSDLFSGGGVFDVFGSGIEFFSDGMKDFICDNPLNEIMGFLDDLPGGFISADFTIPACPAVRPAAYPHSNEIENDRLSGSSRNFADFVEEQKKNNPRARPSYLDDSDEAKNGGGQSDQGAEACNWTD
ncbi:MAG: hypothetical protein IT290_06060 [Deltaproteobacteria bacterium]|nr:hypothetical protein [Deltaproteobacteria bacterium]